jgi:hypothetical protein
MNLYVSHFLIFCFIIIIIIEYAYYMELWSATKSTKSYSLFQLQENKSIYPIEFLQATELKNYIFGRKRIQY